MKSKRLPFTKAEIEKIIQEHPTPFHLYDERGIRENALSFLKAFSWAPGFKEYFAVKACPNPGIVKLLGNLGFGTDCSSLAELVLSDSSAEPKHSKIISRRFSSTTDEYGCTEAIRIHQSLLGFSYFFSVGYPASSQASIPPSIG